MRACGRNTFMRRNPDRIDLDRARFPIPAADRFIPRPPNNPRKTEGVSAVQ
jgi:hypothetical protein